jgi:hypothetical protein
VETQKKPPSLDLLRDMTRVLLLDPQERMALFDAVLG